MFLEAFLYRFVGLVGGASNQRRESIKALGERLTKLGQGQR